MKITAAQINAMTRSELMKSLLAVTEMTETELHKMKQPALAAAFIQIVKDAGELEVEPTKEEKAKNAEINEKATRSSGHKAKEPKPCGCGCGGFTKGGDWLPGHDAKHLSALRGSPNAPKACKCGCGEYTKGGTFRPGHDARYYSQLHKSAGIGLDIKQPHVTSPAFLPETLNPNKWALIGSKEVAA